MATLCAHSRVANVVCAPNLRIVMTRVTLVEAQSSPLATAASRLNDPSSMLAATSLASKATCVPTREHPAVHHSPDTAGTLV